MWARGDADYSRRTGRTDFPPAYLRVRVHGSLDIPSFFEAGEHCTRDILLALKSVDVDPKQVETVLDFGCGSGRTLNAIHREMPTAKLFGTDMDKDAIGWSNAHLDFATFNVNNPEPPLKYTSNKFDLIYAISVFTHIDEQLQYQWLDELARVAVPGAILLLTVHGPSIASSGKIEADQQKQYAEKGFLFVKDKSWSDLFPDFYQTTYHTPEYINANWSKNFDILKYIEHGMDGVQDMVVLRKR